MKKITLKVITISSQLLVVGLFLLSLFVGKGSNDKVAVVYNNNFEKMADRTSSLFKEEELMISQMDDAVMVVLEDNTKEDVLEEQDDESKDENSVAEENKEEKKEEKKEDSSNSNLEVSAIDTYTGILTGYGPDCAGCGNFNTNKVVTSSGYHIANIVDGTIEPAFTITYNDYQYGDVRIVAADDNIPFYSIFRITIPGKDSIMAIVLDRGSTVGFDNCRSSSGCLTNFDLLFATESEAIGKTLNVKFELLRSGK